MIQGPHALVEFTGIEDPHVRPDCPHRMLQFWGSHSQENGISCRKCGATWIHRRRYLRTGRGKLKSISRLVLAPERIP